MRRIPPILLLTVTHGAAVWWGLSGDQGKVASAEASGSAAATKVEAPLDLAKLLEPEPEKPA